MSGNIGGDSGKETKGGAKGDFWAAKKAFKDSKSNDAQSNPNAGQADDNQEEAGSVQDTAKSSGKGKDGAKKTKDAAKRGKKIFDGLKGIQSLAPLVSALSTIGIALLIIFLIIGFIGFFTTLPGLAMEKITEACKKFWGWVKGAEKIEISESDLVDLANYIQELGYELVGNGFASSNQIKRKEDTGEVTAVKTDYEGNPGDTPNYLYAYVLQNERMYTLRDVKKTAAGHLLSWIPGVGSLENWIETSIRKSKYIKSKESYGMLHFDPDVLNDDWWNEVNDFTPEIDRDNMKLKIKTHSGFLGWRVDQMNWDLDGWTGRYGKPIELSLALHLSTMAPDFAYDFCMDSDLQTDIELGAKEVEYNIEYSFIPNNNPELTITKDDVIAEYEKQKETMNVQKIHNLMYNKNHEITGNRWYWMEDDGLPRMCPPIDIIESTSIYRIDDVRGYPNTQRSYTLQESLFTNNSLNYLVFEEDDNTPEVYPNLDNLDIKNQNSFFTIADYFRRNTSWDIVDSYGIFIEAISMEDMLSILNSDENYDAKKAVLKYLESDCADSSDTHYDFGFRSLMYCMDDTIRYIREYDPHAAFHDTSVGYEKRYREGIALWQYRDGGYEWFSDDIDAEVVETASKMTAEFLMDLREDIRKDMDKIENYTQVIIDNNLSDVEEWGLSGQEFRLLYDIMVEQESNVHTFKPYINKVTHHWYKDVYFNPDDEDYDHIEGLKDFDSAYDFTKEIEDETKEYNPEGVANTEDIQSLKKAGRIMYTLNGGKDVTQIKQPYIIKTEPWHNKVKNWLTSGYFFIYDGTIETAEEIESARKVLKYEYDSSNPLLISYGNKKLLIDSDNNEQPEVAEIDEKAKELNNILASTEYKDGKKYKVRLQKINFAKKSSLAAFSILEGVHTKDGEYVYRDLKEFMIELGYFSKGDFETIESNVLDWIIPDYLPYEWPDKKYEKKNDKYGTYIRSKTSLAKEALSNSNNEETKNLNNSSNEPSSETNTSSVEESKVDAGNYKEEGYNTITTINGISYKNYKQDNGDGVYSTYAVLKPSKSDDYFKNVGCGPTSTAVVLSAYGINGKRNKDALPYIIGEEIGVTTNGTASVNDIKIAFDNRNIKTTVYNKNDTNIYDIMDKALKEGRPIIANVNAGSYSRNGHYIAILGYDADNKLVISNPCGNGIYGNTGKYNPGPVSLQDFISKHLGGGSNTFLITNEVPEKVLYNSTDINAIEGFDSGLDVIIPGQCVVTNLKRGDTSDTITIKFTSSNKVKDMTMKIVGVKINLDIEEGTTIDKGTVIGKTTDEDIKLLMRDSKKANINNIEDYMQPPERKGLANGDGGTIPLFTTSLSRKQFIAGADNDSRIAGTEFEGKMGEFYDICTDNGINPVVAFTRAICESGLHNQYHNFWGLATPNGANTPQLADTMLGTLQIFCDTINEYQDPASWQYEEIMRRYNERKDCTENGGCSESGYGTPDTIEGVISLYAVLGDHVYGSSGTGGYYYLDPDRANVTTIYKTHEEFINLCKNKHTEGSEVTVWENAQYTAWNVQRMAEEAEKIWGEEALK